ncbi:MAG: hypothetical protein WCS77_07350 [Elusimicrobiaceae bacterium]|jgi:hypothetical protein
MKKLLVFLLSAFSTANCFARSAPSGLGRMFANSEYGDKLVYVFIAFFVIVIVFLLFYRRQLSGNGNAGYAPRGSAVESSRDQILRQLEVISATDPVFSAGNLSALAQKTFTALKTCRVTRDCDPVQSLLFPDLFMGHYDQVERMAKNHEINKIEDLAIESVDLIHFHYTGSAELSEFTALVTFSARDYYVDERTQSFFRGDREQVRYREYLSFQFVSGQCLLRAIERG